MLTEATHRVPDRDHRADTKRLEQRRGVVGDISNSKRCSERKPRPWPRWSMVMNEQCAASAS